MSRQMVCIIQLSDGTQQILSSSHGFQAIVDAEGYLTIQEHSDKEGIEVLYPERLFVAQYQWKWYKFEDREVA